MLHSEAIRERRPQLNPIRLDAADMVILRELSDDARTPNNVLARRAGLAPSTCLNRVRALREAGVIRGFHADISLGSLGLDVGALISINVHAQARKNMLELARGLRDLPETLNVFVLGGEHDLLLHVACASTGDLRDFVAAHLGSNQSFVNTQTTLIFEHLQPVPPVRTNQ
ncbi:Lrp/AsnC family transcriptional regulator [Pseudarthrobacter sp. SSS035]|uniref:Lrp/AsnC family transcriptional regulator n=1 Tax=Pseudarthrobacter sp. SSS035 TaxID=2931399 RepID=UPI00200E399C|nr:Lrp/AsnC family transcriptional regulator [Pseudarthrobacter sp. SSS035]